MENDGAPMRQSWIETSGLWLTLNWEPHQHKLITIQDSVSDTQVLTHLGKAIEKIQQKLH